MGSWRELLFLHLILVNIVSTLTVSQPDFLSYYNISESGNYSTNSTYQNNLVALLSSLSNSTDKYAFYSSSVGENSYRVYAIVLCRGDVDLDSCRGCINDATMKLPQLLPNYKAAIRWYDLCMLRYSDKSIYGIEASSPTFFSGNQATAWSVNEFNQAVKSLLDGLRSQAASGGARRKFATNNKAGPDFQTIYGLMQCTPDLTQRVCNNCLGWATEQIPQHFGGKIRGRFLTPTCALRYESYPFFTDIPADAPAEAPPTTSGDAPPDAPAEAPPSTSAEHSCVYAGNITDYIDEFDKTLDDLVDELMNRAAEGCLRAAVEMYQNRFLRRGGVNIMTPSCIFQYDLSPFVESSVGDPPPPSPPPPPPSPPPPPVIFAPPPPPPEHAPTLQYMSNTDTESRDKLVMLVLHSIMACETSGQKTNSIHNGVEGLLSYAWKTWREGTTPNLIDPALRANSSSMEEMVRCIHIGLLCAQENVAKRPTMDSVIHMLSSSSLNLPPDFILSTSTSESGNSSSKYQTNLHNHLSTLSNRTDKYGFYNSSFGGNPDKVYAIVLCRGDIEQLELDTCRSCINDSTIMLPRLHPNYTGAIGWYDNYMLRYSDESMNGIKAIDTNGEPHQAASGRAHLKFVTGNTSAGLEFQTIYGLMQCTPDLSNMDCNNCLQGSNRFRSTQMLVHQMQQLMHHQSHQVFELTARKLDLIHSFVSSH
ncbi:hypothetical protein RHSIM_Rhsim07G0196100 [Rhododendron simsii]|uniref:Gnk2-homologous domain-containing protein n=1 Tax=Rhododendron simsii TaxID=118357 RepID=A0A834GMS8_RHOSS|nr:hypothetical protein RHSIM_Rhsim07G0196100 [Rhododendron simsii]